MDLTWLFLFIFLLILFYSFHIIWFFFSFFTFCCIRRVVGRLSKTPLERYTRTRLYKRIRTHKNTHTHALMYNCQDFFLLLENWIGWCLGFSSFVCWLVWFGASMYACSSLDDAHWFFFLLTVGFSSLVLYVLLVKHRHRLMIFIKFTLSILICTKNLYEISLFSPVIAKISYATSMSSC